MVQNKSIQPLGCWGLMKLPSILDVWSCDYKQPNLGTLWNVKHILCL
jgi:hypothetical protein